MRTSDEITVSMIHIPTWENELRLVEITQLIPIEEWLHKSAHLGNRVEVPPYDSLIAGGRYDGGHVLMLHTEDNTFLYAVLPEVILLLEGLLPDEQYRQLLERTPGLATITASRRI